MQEQRTANCGCRLLVEPATGDWSMQAPCSPSVWSDWQHQVTAAADVTSEDQE